MNWGIALAERGFIPDVLIRAAIRSRLSRILKRENPGDAEARQRALRDFIQGLYEAPVALAPLESNRQHYEVPPAFFQLMLGRRMKYSCCVWSESELGRKPKALEVGSEEDLLGKAEQAALEQVAQRARLEDGMRILELGCGWGSLSLWMAEKFPSSHIVAVSHSRAQGEFIQAEALSHGLNNLTVLTADMNVFSPPQEESFHRVVSVEMFEHMRNWPELLRRISTWLDKDGLFFLHVFAHRELAYAYREEPGEWMAQNFFSGGMMPSDSLVLNLQHHLVLEDHWRLQGNHYARTLESWLALLDSRRARAIETLGGEKSDPAALRSLQQWRIFLMACAELFAFRGGNEWLVSQYLMSRRG